MFLLIPHQVFAALQMIYRQEQWKGGGCSDPGSTAEVVSSMSSWWGINVIWHNGRIRKKLCLYLTLWQAHDGVWPRGRGPEWEEPKARSRVRGQGQARITRESQWESESYTRGGLLSPKPFCALQTWAYKYFPVLFLHFASAINSKHIPQKAKNRDWDTFKNNSLLEHIWNMQKKFEMYTCVKMYKTHKLK